VPKELEIAEEPAQTEPERRADPAYHEQLVKDTDPLKAVEDVGGELGYKPAEIRKLDILAEQRKQQLELTEAQARDRAGAGAAMARSLSREPEVQPLRERSTSRLPEDVPIQRDPEPEPERVAPPPPPLPPKPKGMPSASYKTREVDVSEGRQIHMMGGVFHPQQVNVVTQPPNRSENSQPSCDCKVPNGSNEKRQRRSQPWGFYGRSRGNLPGNARAASRRDSSASSQVRRPV